MSGEKEKGRTAGWLLVVGLSVVALGALWISREIRWSPEPAGWWPGDKGTTATVLQNPMDAPTFRLVDQHGKAFGPESLRGHWTYLFFGYTYCPDVCPTTLGVLAQTSKLIQAQDSTLSQPQVVFVSVDPIRDDKPGRLAEYMAYFNPSFLGVTGPEKQLRYFTQPLGIHYLAHPPDAGDDNYLVDHSAAILLFDPQGRLRALTSPPHSAATIAADYGTILKKY